VGPDTQVMKGRGDLHRAGQRPVLRIERGVEAQHAVYMIVLAGQVLADHRGERGKDLFGERAFENDVQVVCSGSGRATV
jgi:hypothetical protein